MDGQPRTSAQDRTLSSAEEVREQLGIGVTEPPRTSVQDRTRMAVSDVDEIWQRTGIGVTKSPQTSAQDQTQKDGWPPTSARYQMQVDERLQTSLKGMAMVPGMPESDAEFQAVQMDTQISDEAIHNWSSKKSDVLSQSEASFQDSAGRHGYGAGVLWGNALGREEVVGR